MGSKHTSPRYEDDSSSAGDNEKTSFLHDDSVNQKESWIRRNMVLLTFFNLFLFMISALTLLCAVFSQSTTSIHSAAKLMDDFSIFSPAKHVVEYHKMKFDLASPLNSSKYVGTTNDVERAWKDIAYLPDQMIRLEDLPQLQKPEDSLKVIDPNTGETGYRVGLEVFHQLQCLDMLRMSTYPNYSTRLWTEMSNKPEKVRAHLDECVETLRMSLMCHSDVHVFTFRDAPARGAASPDYASHHVCRNFAGIRQWALDNAMPEQSV
ncbi:hypothetical protein BDV96DRAFT_640362 [Lophiotrema nucula]|uniref:Tat pathway signal sequence n=1 Tax=Lophiotrema nucula TaxID=690887 RepID=A0A6A5ZTV9_9PLEO|nr:hypothetical protein BDV96DRAFT_640362 [Lophiotrema nucula]